MRTNPRPQRLTIGYQHHLSGPTVPYLRPSPSRLGQNVPRMFRDSQAVTERGQAASTIGRLEVKLVGKANGIRRSERIN